MFQHQSPPAAGTVTGRAKGSRRSGEDVGHVRDGMRNKGCEGLKKWDIAERVAEDTGFGTQAAEVGLR